MKTIISDNIIIEEPSSKIWQFAKENLVVNNPEYQQMKVLGKEDLIKWKNIPEKLNLYIQVGNKLIFSFGLLRSLFDEIRKYPYELHFNDNKDISIKNNVSTFPLYDYQEQAIEEMIKAKGGVLVAPCGSGKTVMGIELIRRIGKRTLWLCHTGDLLRQAKDDMLEQYPNIKIGLTTKGKLEIGQDVTISTIQTMEKIDPDLYKNEFDVIVCDECFPGNTIILTNKGYKKIKDLSIGEKVLSYNKENEIEFQPITHLFKHIPKKICKIKLSNNEEIICTTNHPIYTKNGYKQAKELNENDYVLRYMWETVKFQNNKKGYEKSNNKKRMGLLLFRMFKRRCKKKKKIEYNIRNKKKMERKYEKDKFFTKNDRFKRIKKGNSSFKRTKRKVKHNCKNKRFYVFYSGGEWNRNSNSTKKSIRLFKNKKYRMLLRICSSYKNEEKRRLSYTLQNRYCNSKQNDFNRSRWLKPSKFDKTIDRQKERKFLEWIRVENNKIQKPTSDGTFGGVCNDGYVYNIEVNKNNNYFANNILVHNCAHVAASPTQMKMFAKVISKIPARYKYGLTATPTRSDGMIKAMYCYIGTNKEGDFKPTFKVDKIKVKTIQSIHKKVELFTGYDDFEKMYELYDSAGMMNYNNLIANLSNNELRNEKIVENILKCNEEGRKQVVLCLRVEHCELIQQMLKDKGVKVELCVGKVSDKKRKQILKQEIEWDVIVATYSLLKEGISIKELDTLHMTVPIADKGMVVQCAGRIERYIENKKQPIIYDYVDMDIPYCEKKFNLRKRYLRTRF